MRGFLLIVIIAAFLLTACGVSTASAPAQPTAALDQPVPTQPPAATRDPAAPVPGVAEPTATQLPGNPAAQPVPASTEMPASLPPTVAPVATLAPTVLPVKESPMPIQPAPAPNAQPLTPPFDSFIQRQIDVAKQDLAQRLGIDVAAIEVASVEAVTWPDGALGCPRPGMAYIQVLIDGLRILLRVGDQLYPYHSGDNQPPFLCESQMGPRAQP
ncbi:hypothetical protein [Chloroflexus sp.]|uniref:hypothetical protein n=1 Tax=Chloroflexus sp. TaxID=1904827 RepID=UPI002ACE0DF9|nr:hypothetical protein [Chloroflexus sp.]